MWCTVTDHNPTHPFKQVWVRIVSLAGRSRSRAKPGPDIRGERAPAGGGTGRACRVPYLSLSSDRCSAAGFSNNCYLPYACANQLPVVSLTLGWGQVQHDADVHWERGDIIPNNRTPSYASALYANARLLGGQGLGDRKAFQVRNLPCSTP